MVYYLVLDSDTLLEKQKITRYYEIKEHKIKANIKEMDKQPTCMLLIGEKITFWVWTDIHKTL